MQTLTNYYDNLPHDILDKCYSKIIYPQPNNLLKQIRDYYYKNTQEYNNKLLDSDSEEFWDEYIPYNDVKFMEEYCKKFTYSNPGIYNYKTGELIKIKVLYVA
tara:strand:+ start:1576 stop:1884 length:309 start_codon:yes stop_codon:yes gene_type:complete